MTVQQVGDLIERFVEYRAEWTDGTTVQIVRGFLHAADYRFENNEYLRPVNHHWWVLRFDKYGILTQQLGYRGDNVVETLTALADSSYVLSDRMEA